MIERHYGQRQLQQELDRMTGLVRHVMKQTKAAVQEMGVKHISVPNRPTKNLDLKYKKGHVALSVPGSFFNILGFSPKKNFVRIRFRVSDPETWITRLSEAGIEAELKNHGTRVLVRLRNGDLDQHESLLRELIHQAMKEKAES